MRKSNRNLADIPGEELSKIQARMVRGGDDPDPEWEGECAVHYQTGEFWKLITWSWPGTGAEAEKACTKHYTDNYNGAYCFCNYVD